MSQGTRRSERIRRNLERQRAVIPYPIRVNPPRVLFLVDTRAALQGGYGWPATDMLILSCPAELNRSMFLRLDMSQRQYQRSAIQAIMLTGTRLRAPYPQRFRYIFEPSRSLEAATWNSLVDDGTLMMALIVDPFLDSYMRQSPFTAITLIMRVVDYFLC
ncbi:uncharacterized protein LOC108099250 [Drosophila ficusphila]|uniref:uncharacterized protein LOC108099250 n=1 Tax=Drosophila ficusphila TaxID=30025 RepID=UPI0007E6F192|nr:uncharacterized protein LOC108099250 [Drosophila ficusphila]